MDVKSHAYFGATAWDLMHQQALPAPWLPNPELVYAKDFVAPISFHEPLATERAGDDSITDATAGWEYHPSRAEFAQHELRAFVRKLPTVAVVSACASP
jgi:hypothetical protein